ncbi:MAG: AraC family transcriptional regulator [Pseudomonadota bacterium]
MFKTLNLAEMMRAITKIKIIFLVLVLLTFIAGYAVIRYSHTANALLPIQQSTYPWRPFAAADVNVDESSFIDLRDSTYNLNFDFNLSTKAQYPYAILALLFQDDKHPEQLIDWSKYSSITLRVKCRPDNIVDFTLRTFDSQVSVRSDISTFRPSTTFFNCGEQWRQVQLNLHQLETQEWWMLHHKLNLSNRGYALDKVGGFYLANSRQSPTGILSSVAVEEIILEGRNWYLVYITACLGIMVWVGFFYWCRSQIFSFPNKLQITSNLTPVSYQQLATEPRHERDKSAVVDYLASHYSNPNLSVDIVVNDLGINRGKINDILREETGLTFSAYLNKLRMTEAARLLSERHMGVAEAAYAVGYGSISNFNRVFKKEYGFAPSNYKNPIAIQQDSDPVNPQK